MKTFILLLSLITSVAFASGTFIKGSGPGSHLTESATAIVSAAGTTTLTNTSETFQIVSGVTTQTIVLPSALTIEVYRVFKIRNRSTGTVTVNKNGGTLAGLVLAGQDRDFKLTVAGGAPGTWDVTGFIADLANGVVGVLARANVAAGTASHVVINDGAGLLSSEAQLAISRGGTGQATAVAAFNALAPTTTEGDLIQYSGGNNVRVPVGSAGNVLTVVGGRWAAAAVAGTGTVTSVDMTVPTNFAVSGNPITGAGTLAVTLPGGVHNDSTTFTNCSVAVSAAGNTLAVDLKDQAGSNPSASSPCKIAMRNATITTGSYVVTSFTAAAGILLGTTDSLGFTTTVADELNIYSIEDGTDEVCLSKLDFDEASVQSATALTGGAEVSGLLLYCTSAHTSRPIRKIGKILATWTNAVGWAFSNSAVIPHYRAGNSVRGYLADTAFPVAANTYVDLITFSLTPGKWSIDLMAYIRNGGVVTTTGAQFGISETSGDFSTGLIAPDNIVEIGPLKSLASGSLEYVAIPGYVVRPTVTTTYYVKGFAGGSITSLAVGARVTATRIGD